LSRPAVRAEGLTRRFGRRWALRGVDLEVAPGTVLALLGENGTGKTTLLRVLATLLGPTAGTAEVLGVDVVADADSVRRRTALLTPLGHAYEELTGLENLRFAARMSGDHIPAGALATALADVGLADVGELAVRGYSTGMRKRLELARLGLREPELVLLDEPFTSLDAPGIELMQDAIGRWRAAGTTVLIASHRVEETARHADRTVRLAGGVIVNAAESS